VNSNFRWELRESLRDLKSSRSGNRWLCADEDSNNKQVRSSVNAIAFIEIPPNVPLPPAPQFRQRQLPNLKWKMENENASLLSAVSFGLASENGLGFHIQKSQKSFVGQRRRDALPDRPPVGMRPDAQIVAGETGVGQHSPAVGQGKCVKIIAHSGRV